MKFNRITIIIILVSSSLSLLFSVAYGQNQTTEEMAEEGAMNLQEGRKRN